MTIHVWIIWNKQILYKYFANTLQIDYHHYQFKILLAALRKSIFLVFHFGFF